MKKLIALLLALVMVLSLAACGAKEPAPTEAPKAETPAAPEAPQEEPAPTEAPVEIVKLNVAYMPNYASLWSVLTAIDKGYFAEEGLEITLWEFADGPSEIAAMEGGSIDLAYIGHGAHKLCINGRAQIFLPSSVHATDRIIVLPSAGINSAEEIANLKGKKVAYNAGSSSETALQGALKVAGLTMDDITAMEMGAENLTTAMLSGSLDACACWSPNSLKIMEEMEGATKLADNVMFSDNSVSLASWIVLDGYASENADNILAFTKALYKAMDYAADANYEEVAGYVAAQTKTDEAGVYAQRGDADWLTGAEVASGAADGTVENYYKVQQANFLASGAVTEEVPVADYVMLDNMIEAGK